MKDKKINEELINKIDNKKEEKKIESIIDQDTQEGGDKKSIKINKKIIIIFGVLILVMVLIYALRGFFVVATVDGSPISRLSIIQKLEKVSGKSLLDSMISEKLIQREASSKKIVISDDEVNAYIKTIEDQFAGQGNSLAEALSTQGMTMDDYKKQVILRKQVEKLLSNKINVTDEEVMQYIKDSGIEIPEGQEVLLKEEIKKSLIEDRFSEEAQKFVNNLKLEAKINYFVNY